MTRIRVLLIKKVKVLRMYKNMKRNLIVLMLFSLFLFATTSPINGNILQTDEIKQVNKVNSRARF